MEQQENYNRASGPCSRVSDLALNRRDCKGFTLLEVLVALAVLGTAVVIILQLFSANLRSVWLSEEFVAACVAGEVKMRDLLEGDKLTEPASWSETTDDGYRMDISISDILKERTDNLPVKMIQIDLTVKWNNKRSYKSIELKTIKMVDKQQTEESRATGG